MDTPTSFSNHPDDNPDDAHCAPRLADIYTPFACTEAMDLPAAVPTWTVEFSQLSPGHLIAQGGVVTLGCASISRFTIDQTLQHVGSPPRGSTGILIPGVGSREAFALGRQLAPGQCVTVADGSWLDAITRDRYVDLALAVDSDVWTSQSHWLDGSVLTSSRGARIQNPGPHWISRMQGIVDWIFMSIERHPQSMVRAEVQGSITDLLLLALSDVGNAGDAAHYSRQERMHQRLAVERAREYIQAKLSEPLRLSELCRHARVHARSLEYGFREVTGLSPIAYVKSLRLNAVRKALSRRSASQRSITEIALDQGFWHLSQFAVDYRKLFGEAPSWTRKRTLARHAH